MSSNTKRVAYNQENFNLTVSDYDPENETDFHKAYLKVIN